MTELAGFQRKYLRGLAHDLKPVIQVGRQGVTDDLIQALQRALEEHELVKISMHKPKNKKAMAADLSARSNAQLCGLIGHTVILFRAHPEKPGIRLPKRAAAPEEGPQSQ